MTMNVNDLYIFLKWNNQINYTLHFNILHNNEGKMGRTRQEILYEKIKIKF